MSSKDPYTHAASWKIRSMINTLQKYSFSSFPSLSFHWHFPSLFVDPIISYFPTCPLRSNCVLFFWHTLQIIEWVYFSVIWIIMWTWTFYQTETMCHCPQCMRIHTTICRILVHVTAIFCIFKWDKNKHKRYAWLCKVHFKNVLTIHKLYSVQRYTMAATKGKTCHRWNGFFVLFSF